MACRGSSYSTSSLLLRGCWLLEAGDQCPYLQLPLIEFRAFPVIVNYQGLPVVMVVIQQLLGQIPGFSHFELGLCQKLML